MEKFKQEIVEEEKEAESNSNTVIIEEEEEVEEENEKTTNSNTELTKKDEKEEKVETNNNDDDDAEIEEEEEDIDDKFFDAIKETINSKNNILELDINNFVEEQQIDSNDNNAKLNLFTSIILVIQKNDNPLSITYLNYISLLEFFKDSTNLCYSLSYETRKNIFSLKLISTQKDDMEEDTEEEILEKSIDINNFINLVVDTARLFNIRLNENMITNLFENLSGELCELNSWENLFAICNSNAISDNFIYSLLEYSNVPFLGIAIVQTERQDIFQQASFSKNTIESIIMNIFYVSYNVELHIIAKNILNLLKLCAKGEFPENHVKFIDNKLFSGNGKKFIVTNDFLENILPAFSPESLSLSFKRHLLENYNDNLSEEILFNLISNYFNNKEENEKIEANLLINFFKHYKNILSENILAPLLKYLPEKIIIELLTYFKNQYQLTAEILASAYKSIFEKNELLDIMDSVLISLDIDLIKKIILVFKNGDNFKSDTINYVPFMLHLLELTPKISSEESKKKLSFMDNTSTLSSKSFSHIIISAIINTPQETNISQENLQKIYCVVLKYKYRNYFCISQFIINHLLNDENTDLKINFIKLLLNDHSYLFTILGDEFKLSQQEKGYFIKQEIYLFNLLEQCPYSALPFNDVYDILNKNDFENNILFYLCEEKVCNFINIIKNGYFETITERDNLERIYNEIYECLSVWLDSINYLDTLRFLEIFTKKTNEPNAVPINQLLFKKLLPNPEFHLNNQFLDYILNNFPNEYFTTELVDLLFKKYNASEFDYDLIARSIAIFRNKISPYSMISFLKNCDNDAILESNFIDFALKSFPPNAIFDLFAEILIPRQLIQSVITNENFNTVYNLLKENNNTNIFSFLCNKNETTFFYLLGLLKADNLTIISNEMYLYLTSEPVFENKIFWSQIFKGSEIQCKILYSVFVYIHFDLLKNSTANLKIISELFRKLNFKEKFLLRKPTNLNNLYENYPDLKTRLFIIINVLEKEHPQVVESLNKFFSWFLEEIQQKSPNANTNTKSSDAESEISGSDSEKQSLKQKMAQAKTIAENQKETNPNPKSKNAIGNNENDFSDFSEEEDK